MYFIMQYDVVKLFVPIDVIYVEMNVFPMATIMIILSLSRLFGFVQNAMPKYNN